MQFARDVLNRLKEDKLGASAAEYALILALVAGGIVLGFTNLGLAIERPIEDAAAKIEAG